MSEPVEFTPQMAKQMEVSQTVMIDWLPPLWFGLFKKCKEEGFTEYQAMQCIIAYIQKPGS